MNIENDIIIENDINENNINENEEEYKVFNNWDELNISENLLRGIYSYGFEYPSSIQKKSILSILEGKDIIAQSQSGSGKTGAFTIGALSLVNTKMNETQILIISPTRELTIQIFTVISNLSNMMNDIKIYSLIGGKNIADDIQYLKNNKPHILVACLGRLNDMIHRNLIHLKSIKTIIIDEVDEIFSSQHNDSTIEKNINNNSKYQKDNQLFNIFNKFSKQKKIQYVFFSATLSQPLHTIFNNIMNHPVKIIVKSESLTLEGISQYFVALENDSQKYSVIKDLYSNISLSQSIIYCNSINRVNILYNSLLNEGFPVCKLEGNMNKKERNDSFDEFKKGKYRVLISTNITSRGIDIQQVSIVINFDVPKCKHTYLHRIGRSGRFGKKGIAINLITRNDVPMIKEIENYYGTEINELPNNISW